MKKLILVGFLVTLFTGLFLPSPTMAQSSNRVIKMEVKSERLTEAQALRLQDPLLLR